MINHKLLHYQDNLDDQGRTQCEIVILANCDNTISSFQKL